MGFEPFIPPKRAPEKMPEGSREERVLALAKLLHSRGITSSLTDAKRLAEGMVDVERKVIKHEEPRKAPEIHVEQPRAQKQSFGLNLPEQFAHFVAQAAAISHEETKPSIAIPEPAHMSYGRETLQNVAEVPHVHAHKQVFFADAPDITQARGYKSPPVTPQQEAKETLQQVTRVEATAEGVKVVRVESSPTVQTVQEEIVVEDLPEKTTELPRPEKPAEREDLAKKHGVDIFQMFKKK